MSGQEVFSHRVKAEAAKNITGRKKCDACLGGMLLFAGTFSADKAILKTENADVAALFTRLCEHAAEPGCVSAGERSRKGLPPVIRLEVGAQSVKKITERIKMDPMPGPRRISFLPEPDEMTVGPFAAGAFLACGSVVSPEKEYHLEFVVPEEPLCCDLQKLFEDRFGISGRITERSGAYVLYFKESESVEDILTLIGAPMSSVSMMNVKIYKDIRNQANRATNCDTANLGRQNRSAQRQIEAIERIIKRDGSLLKLPEELRELCELRLKFPETSLSELKDLTDPPMSRSGVNHRFERILAIAEEKEKP